MLQSLSTIDGSETQIPLTKGMRLYWSIDVNLQSSFNINDIDGLISFAAWLLVYQQYLPGLNIAKHARKFSAFADCVNQMICIKNYSLPALAYATWQTRDDLRSAFDIATEKGRSALCGNLLLKDQEATLHIWNQKKYLSEPVEEAGNLPRVLYAIWLTRSDLQNCFPFEKRDFEQKILRWAFQYGCSELPKLKEILNYSTERSENRDPPEFSLNSHEVSSLRPSVSSNWENTSISQITVDASPLPHGVNLFGYAFSSSGLGMDLRMVATSLKYEGIPFCVIDCPNITPLSRSELEFQAYEATEPHFDTTIFCLPCGEIYRAMCMLGDGYFTGQYLIGQMPWEFSTWPHTQIPILQLLDEVWCLSDFILQAVAPICPVPFKKVYRPVQYESQPDITRSDFDIPLNVFTFFFMWDSLSYSSRKNPDAVVRAFKQAFDKSITDVHLILKTQHYKHNKYSDELADAISQDKRIQIIEGILTQKEIWGLHAACDVYVSLHRSEGFGLSLAEAMLAKKTVIASAYSGNLDFCTPETALLVPGEIIPVSSGAYPLADGLEWFDADTNEAANIMRRCYINRNKDSKYAISGYNYIKNNYSVEICAAYYHECLKQIWKHTTESIQKPQ